MEPVPAGSIGQSYLSLGPAVHTVYLSQDQRNYHLDHIACFPCTLSSRYSACLPLIEVNIIRGMHDSACLLLITTNWNWCIGFFGFCAFSAAFQLSLYIFIFRLLCLLTVSRVCCPLRSHLCNICNYRLSKSTNLVTAWLL